MAAARPLVILLMGPTAAGKTGIAIEMARRLPVDIVSVDSALVYRDMNIGTAKPDPHVLAEVPHRLVDILDPSEAYSAAQFRADALNEIEKILAVGRTPLLVGGTMLYFRALERGLAELPEADPEVRARLEAEAQAQGWAALHARLAEVDPQAAARIHANDPQRIQRALEVYELAGEPLSHLIARAQSEPLPYSLAKWIIAPRDRRVLHERIETRFNAMLAAGFVEEVEKLRARPNLDLGKPSMRAVGYRQIWEYLDGQYDYATMVKRGIVATRQFAKRQLTWLRAESGGDWFPSEDPDLTALLIARAEAVLR